VKVVDSAFTADPRIQVEHLSKKYCSNVRRSLWYGLRDIVGEFRIVAPGGTVDLRRDEFWALHDVSFQLGQGDALALIGPNGAGKSSLLKLLHGLIKPDAGRIRVCGRVAALIELGAGFNPLLTGRENIYVSAALMGLGKREINALVDEIIDFAEVGDFIDAPLQAYSSGMWVRLGYAVAASLKPDILLADEILAVGDVTFQRKCIRHMQKYLAEGGILVLVSHNLYQVQNVCSRSIVLEHGRIAFQGSATEGVQRYFEMQSPNATGRPGTGSRSDAGPVEICGVSLEPLEGDVIRSEAAVRLVVDYRATGEISRASWGFGIWTADLSLCIGAAWQPSIDLDTGRGRLACLLPRIPFTPGTYAMRVGILDTETRVPLCLFGYEDAPAFVVVRSMGSQAENLMSINAALTRLDVRWE
jgi:ABC-type polysaccharide/polyol phosphate transport system ATPase subunit